MDTSTSVCKLDLLPSIGLSFDYYLLPLLLAGLGYGTGDEGTRALVAGKVQEGGCVFLLRSEKKKEILATAGFSRESWVYLTSYLP